MVHSPSDEIDNLELSFDEMHFSPLQRPLLSPSLYNSDIDENDPMFVPPLNLGESQFHRRRERYSSSPLPHSSYNSGHSPAGTDTSFASSPGGGFNVVHMMMYTRSEITDSVPALYRALNESEDVKLSEKFSLDSLKTVWLNYFSLSYNKALQSDIILEQISNFNVEIVAAATAFNALQQKKIVGVEIEKAKLKSLIHDLFGFTGDEVILRNLKVSTL